MKHSIRILLLGVTTRPFLFAFTGEDVENCDYRTSRHQLDEGDEKRPPAK